MDSGAGVKPDPNERSVSKFQMIWWKDPACYKVMSLAKLLIQFDLFYCNSFT